MSWFDDSRLKRGQGEQIALGRLRVVNQLAGPSMGLSVSVGSKGTRLADVNCDLDRNARPDIVATVFELPFRSSFFDTILFTDVIEHLPPKTENRALLELRRCLKKTGRIILTTPNDVKLFTILDPAHWLKGHRHYSTNKIAAIVDKAGLRVQLAFASGGIWDVIDLLVYYFIRYPIQKILRRTVPGPARLDTLAASEYHYQSKAGYTIFMICTM